MPTFQTPRPITLTLELLVADIRIVASDRKDTVVEVCPRDKGMDADVKAAEQTRVEYADGQLLLKSRKWLAFIASQRGGAVDVTIELPRGSRVNGTASMADLHTDGSLGECLLKVATGDITMDRIAGLAEIVKGVGTLRIRTRLTAVQTIKNLSGDIHIGDVSGEVEIKSRRR